ncbi:ATP-dependent RNA helicase A protein [Dissostichus eleginoides]|uniref:RNA helicase n=1 Tax=Dissostichus eleginoides TaxID=100907 RepID=A0AAD9B9J6_DISEL|nr:ATP-dependent RNA helicase A protein [Dissostichus eleginoides]
MADIKNVLYAWCGKKKLTPNYDIRAAGNKNRQKFLCEVRVDSFSYIGMGNSSNKKDAQTNAARDFVNFLVRSGEMSAAEVPAPGMSAAAGDQRAGRCRVSRDSDTPEEETPEYYAKRDEQEAQATLESEEVDLNANLHGNWTLENAKARLNQFFQKEKCSAEYKYSQVGPTTTGDEYLRKTKVTPELTPSDEDMGQHLDAALKLSHGSFIAEMNLFVRQLGRKITAREHGSNKKLAAQSCALSLVRQLYHLGVLEAYSGVTKKKEGETLEPFDVSVSADLQQQLAAVVQELGVLIPPL